MSQHILFWYIYLSQFQEMKARVSLCKCVDSPEPLLPAYTKYRSRPELRQLALRQLLPICDKYQNLTCWSFLYLSTLYIALNKISKYCFYLDAIIIILLLLSQNKSEIRFQYLVYYIIHTCNTYDNKYTAIYLIFMISFSL